ncbi:MAG: transaldolase [Nanoarchaeota archaeon]|nr:transaldolase [Nanoarchaeota archaeon]
MKIFIDTADLDEIREAFSYGVVDGVTTNPSSIKKAVDKLKEKGKKATVELYLKDILRVAKKTSVSIEVIGTTYEEMIEEAQNLYKKFKDFGNVCIKIPVCPSIKVGEENLFDGIKVIKELSKKKIPTNATLVFTPEQALLAAKAGATYVSPFAGRIDDLLRKRAGIKFERLDYYPEEGLEYKNELLEDNGVVSGIDLIEQIVEIFLEYDLKTKIIAASIRNPRQARECALSGADIATIPYKVIKEMLLHEKTIEGMNFFLKDVVPEYSVVVRKK